MLMYGSITERNGTGYDRTGPDGRGYKLFDDTSLEDPEIS